MNKIMTLPELRLALDVEQRFRDGTRIVQCHGCFDFLHIGHVWHLEAAKKMGDVLVVTVTSDRYVNKGPERPLFPVQQRAEMLAALECVDYVSIVDAPTAEKAILTIAPDMYVKGTDYHNGIVNEESKAVSIINGQMVYTHTKKMSSTDLIRRCAAIMEAA